MVCGQNKGTIKTQCCLRNMGEYCHFRLQIENTVYCKSTVTSRELRLLKSQ
jgi:hypothetical protein